MPTDPVALGTELRQLRELRGASLRDAAEAADISPAYLLKLERGGVQAPSPHVLRRIAEYFEVSYLAMMQQFGYETSDTRSSPRRPGLLASALAAESLTEAEQKAVAAFLSALRAQGGRE